VSYGLELMPSALKDMKALSREVRERLAEEFERLPEDPQPPNSKRLTGLLAAYRCLRVGDYRASYTVDQKARLIQVWRVGHRSTFYKRLQH
jgi:mRNA interferase RelE/StbE